MVVDLEKIDEDIGELEGSNRDFYLSENIRKRVENIGKSLNDGEKDLRKLSCKVADFSNINIKEKFSELLNNTFILKKSYTSSKFVHYFEWGTKNIHFYDVEKQSSKKVTLTADFNIPKFCRSVVTDEGRVFCIGGRH